LITVLGQGFVTDSVIQVNSTSISTTYGSGTSLTATIPAANLATAQTLSISVLNPSGGGVASANFVQFVVSTPATAPGGPPAAAPQQITEVETGSIQSGYAIITPEGSSVAPHASVTFATINNAVVQSQAAVLPAAMRTDTAFYFDLLSAGSRNLGMAIANPSTTSATITVTLRNESGTVIGTPATLTLAGQAQTARFVTDIFSADLLGTAFIGSVGLQSTVPIAAVGLRFVGSEFSTLAPAAIGTASTVPQVGSIGGTNALIFPQVAIGGGWATQMMLVNTGTTTISGKIDFVGPRVHRWYFV